MKSKKTISKPQSIRITPQKSTIDKSNLESFLTNEYYSSSLKIVEFEKWKETESDINYLVFIAKNVLEKLNQGSTSVSVQFASDKNELIHALSTLYGLPPDINTGISLIERKYQATNRLIEYLNQFIKDTEVVNTSEQIPSSLHAAEFAYLFNRLFEQGWFGNPTKGESLTKLHYARLLLNTFQVHNLNGDLISSHSLNDLFTKSKTKVNSAFRELVDDFVVRISEVEKFRNKKKVGKKAH